MTSRPNAGSVGGRRRRGVVKSGTNSLTVSSVSTFEVYPLSNLSAYVAAILFLGVGCNSRLPTTSQAASPAAESPSAEKAEIRITGLVQAVHSVKISVPQIQGQFGNLTLTQLVPNGVRVKEGDLVATFDPATQIDAARDAQAKFEDLGHQVDQKIAENHANAERRLVEFRQA